MISRASSILLFFFAMTKLLYDQSNLVGDTTVRNGLKTAI